MPRFYTDVEAEVDVDIDEFLSSCDSSDIEEIIEYLIEDGCIKNSAVVKGNTSIMEEDFIKQCHELSDAYMQISNEDIEIIEQIYKKYC
jgi:hypothetical protein